MNKKKILLIQTGGTIGSHAADGVIDVEHTKEDTLLRKYRSIYGDETDRIELITLNPYKILSENLTMDHFTILQRLLLSLSYQEYDGIIISHGSDTISYTGAMLGMLFWHIPIPLILIASNYCLEDERSNGVENFQSAITFISTIGLKGVYVVYQDMHKKNVIYLATRICESDPYQDQYGSFGGQPLGWVSAEGVVFHECRENPSFKELQKSKEPVITKEIVFHNQVLGIRPFPGMDYSSFSPNDKTKAVIHYLYHSGTASTNDTNGLPQFIRLCGKRGIKVYGASFKNDEEEGYAGKEELLEAGLIPLVNISWEAALMKAFIAYNQKEIKPEEFMKKVLYYENLQV